jgi:hypothetical protein
MIWFLKGSYEKILAALAVAVLGLSLSWTWRQGRQLQTLREEITPGDASASRLHTPAAWGLPALNQVNWAKAPEQSAGTGWRYELFTPPAIYYNPDAHAFAVAAPRHAAPRGAPTADRSAPVAKSGRFRLQLTGYFGTPDNYLVALVSTESGETLLVRAGRRFPELGLTLTSFEVKKVPVEHGEPWPVYEVVGLATLRDEHTGAEIVLNTRARKRSDNSDAVDEGSPPVTVAGRSDPVSVFPVSSESERGQ